MDPRERAKLRSEISTAFETGSISQADNEQLLPYLQSLCRGVPERSCRHRELLRGFTINYIQMARLIGLLETRNKRTQLLFMVLAVGSILLGLIELLF